MLRSPRPSWSKEQSLPTSGKTSPSPSSCLRPPAVTQQRQHHHHHHHHQQQQQQHRHQCCRQKKIKHRTSGPTYSDKHKTKQSTVLSTASSYQGYIHKSQRATMQHAYRGTPCTLKVREPPTPFNLLPFSSIPQSSIL